MVLDYLLKALIIIIYAIIFWQDYMDRLVYWFLYPVIGLLGFLIQENRIDFYVIVVNSLINLFLVGTVIAILFVYSKLILKKKLINEGIGSGDILLFISLSFSFSIISFFVLFVFSLLFSLLLHILFKNKSELKQSVPLAGYMSIFFAFVYLLSYFVNCNFIFAY